jgi:molybdenum cofactor cytidylyltransferase
MGEPKQLLTFHGQTLLRRAATTALASQCRSVYVVLGDRQDRFLTELLELDLHIVANPEWEQGMGSSIHAGMTALLAASHPDVQAVILMLCDQPLLSAAHLDRLIDAHRRNGDALIVSEYGDTLGVPALFPQSLFSQLLHLEGAMGAKPLIRNYRGKIVSALFPEGVFDMDTPEDYVHLCSL